MRILIISNNYPSEEAPTYGVFVYNLVQQFVKLGHEITVIAPRTIWKKPLIGQRAKQNYGEELATIYRPYVVSASNKQIFNFNTHLIGEKFMVKAVRETVKKENLQFDVVYGHFLVNGIIAVKALSYLGKPIFVAEGELKNINLRKTYYKDSDYQKLISKIEGFIAVSPQIKDNLIEVGVNSDKITISPNAVDFNQFFKRDKVEMRMKHKLPLDKKLVIFVGRFVHDKGPSRVLKAVENIDNTEIIFIGGGSDELISDKIVFKDKVPTNEVHEYLSAADIFVLPTLHEGSCNAIVEAMACGLPIISSDIPEIRFQCEPEFSILVNPLSVEAINEALSNTLFNDEKLMEMGVNAMKYSKKFDITQRAKNIINFMLPSVK
ncbi:glycosyltransferase family 4 protein [Pseudozobellia sp. WGM2]|uniref:glycosyltransferase family 4 protein n=1 Tax=Pseudozobellia sp. WGM2 TaxID=2787625 RepID=UPI001ADEC8CA|nr:glycosyltransferase family 4 protein [Pseudozobellia sp. WGM2]